MTDYTEAALNEATVRLSDGNFVEIFFNHAGQNGWLVDVIGAYEPYSDEVIYFATDGIGLGVDDPNIVEIVE